jgi:hypothetical protein
VDKIIKSILEGPPPKKNLYKDFVLVVEKYPHLFADRTCAGLYKAAKRQLIKQKQDRRGITWEMEDKDFLLSDRRVYDDPLSESQNNFIKKTVEQWTDPVFEKAFKLNQAFPFITFNGLLNDGFVFEEDAQTFVKLTVQECEIKGWVLDLMEDYERDLQKKIFSLGVLFIPHNAQTFKKFISCVKEEKLVNHLAEVQSNLFKFQRLRTNNHKLKYFQRFIQKKESLRSYAYNQLLSELKTVKEYRGRTRSV